METRSLSRKEFLAAGRRSRMDRATIPIALAARYNKQANRIIISLSTKIEVMFDPCNVQGLENASPAQLKEIEITPSGFGLFFPALEEGIDIPNLLEGTMGSRKWMAARLGAQGGKARTAPKAVAARANGALGGRPRKIAAP